MELCSYCIPDKVLFGSYPTTERCKILENNGVNYYVDLTVELEVKIKYDTQFPISHFPIIDRKVPTDIFLFCKFLLKLIKLINQLENGNKIYIHCRGGHGRAGLVVACLLCYIYEYTPEKSIELTSKYHSERLVMRDKWREIGSPQTRLQKSFIFKIFKPLYFYKAYKNGPAVGFSNISLHPTIIDNMSFNTSLAAYEAHRDLSDKNYLSSLQNCNSYQARTIGLKKKKSIADKYNVMKKILKEKIKQHPCIAEKLMNSGFRPILYTYKYSDYWGIGEDTQGANKLGKLWMEIRKEFYD